MENSCFKTKNFLMNSSEVSNWLFYLFTWKMTHTGETMCFSSLSLKNELPSQNINWILSVRSTKKSYNLKLQNMI